jgi:hypothetical protein
MLIVKKTGECLSLKTATDKRYLCDAIEHSVRIPVPLESEAISDLVGKPVVLYSRSNNLLKRIEPESFLKITLDGKARYVNTGILSAERASELVKRCEAGEQLHVLRYRPKVGNAATEFVITRPRGEVFPLTYSTRLECTKLGWGNEQTISAKLKICSRVMRAKLRAIDPASRSDLAFQRACSPNDQSPPERPPARWW